MKRFVVIVPAVLSMFASCGQPNSSSSLQFNATNNGVNLPRSQVNRVGNGMFPRGPEMSTTPGTTCSHGRLRSGVQICDRDVSGGEKASVFEKYDRMFGFRTRSMPRDQFKVDHLIPLCMGGGNDDANLWPQHESIYTLTDPIEPYLCSLVSSHKLNQGEAIQIIREVKQAPETTAARMSQLAQRTHMRP